jgi:hypothetical protein
MKKSIFLSSLFCCLTVISFCQPNFNWAKSMGGNLPDGGSSIKLDALGNVYISGYFSGTVDFDPGAAIYNLTSKGGLDFFIQKLDFNGNLIWAKSIGGSMEDVSRSITLDSFNNIYLTGYFEGSVDFDPGTGVFNLNSSGGSKDIFIEKLDVNGNFLWAKTMTGDSLYSDEGTGIEIDQDNNIYVTGYFSGTVDFDPNIGVYNISSNSIKDIFIQKLNQNGNLIWVKSVGGNSEDHALDITIDNLNNVYTTGFFIGAVDFNPGPGVYPLGSKGAWDIFILKLDSSGNFIWAKSMGAINYQAGYHLSTDINSNVFLTGAFEETVDFDSGAGIYNLTSNGGEDIFVVKLNSNGDFQWANSLGSSMIDNAWSITNDLNGNVYLAGYFHNTIDFDPGIGVLNLSSSGLYDIFIQKLDNNGNLMWVVKLGSTGADWPQGIELNSSGELYLTGGFNNTVDFDPGNLVFNLNSLGNSDAFVLKLGSTVGIIENEDEIIFSIYPNPAKDVLNFENSTTQINNIKIIDLNGKIVKSSILLDNQIRVEDLTKGVYFLQLEAKNSIFTYKFIKN